MTKNIFFAFQGKRAGVADENVDAIRCAIGAYNTFQHTHKAHSWEEFRKSTLVTDEILQAIRESEIFVCDLTHFNHNVLFEFGYALGLNKKILVLLNPKICLEEIGFSGDIYKNSIFKNIRYTPLSNKMDILDAIKKESFEENLFGKLVPEKNRTSNGEILLYIRSGEKNQAAIDLDDTIDTLSKDGYFECIVDDPTEVSYNTINWYINNISRSKHVVFHFLGQNIKDYFLKNANNSFFAGIAAGLGKRIIIFAPAKYAAPLDYHEILCQYQTSNDLCEKAIEWAPKQSVGLVKKADWDNDLFKLGLWQVVAEGEKEALLDCFVETASYYSALRSEKSIFVGRKGAGKSAIYLKLLEDYLGDDRNYVINLKPESDELLENLNLSELYKTSGSKLSFFKTVWKFVVFSKLVGIVHERLKRVSRELTPEEQQINHFVEENKNFIKMNFFGVIKEISDKSSATQSPKVLEDFYKSYLGPLVKILKDYFKSISCKYLKIVIMADNLDKTWEAKADLNLQVDMITTLLEIDKKVSDEFSDVKDQRIEVAKILFLRKDIFSFICKNVSEPDKMVAMSHEINWDNYPALLKKVVDNRFKKILNLQTDEDVEKAWGKYFTRKSSKTHPFDEIRKIVASRPRDVMYFFAQLFESAANKSHKKVDNDDIAYAIESYTQFINQNLIAETMAEFPEITDILARLQKYYGEKIEYREFVKILDEFGYSEAKKNQLVKILFANQYMLGYDRKAERITDHETLVARLNTKFSIWNPATWFMSRNMYVIAHARHYLIKHKLFESF